MSSISSGYTRPPLRPTDSGTVTRVVLGGATKLNDMAVKLAVLNVKEQVGDDKGDTADNGQRVTKLDEYA